MNIGPNGEQYAPTVYESENFDPDQDAVLLRKAMKGIGCDEKAIIEILSKRIYDQRTQIADSFKRQFGEDLRDKLKSELSGNFEKVVLSLFASPAKLNALACYKAIKGIGTDEDVLVSILASSTNEEIRQIKAAYQEVLVENGKDAVHRNLEKDVKGDCGGLFGRVLVILLQAARKEPSDEQMVQLRRGNIESVIDRQLAKSQAQELYNAGEGKLGTDEVTFMRILGSESVWQIAAIDLEYTKLTSKTLLKSISSELSGDLKSVMHHMVKACLDRPSLYADMLHKSMKGLGTDDDTLIRIVVTRSEVDMGTIKESFRITHSKVLGQYIADDVSGDYKKILLKLIGE